MKRHRRPPPKVSKHHLALNLDHEILTMISLVYEDLVEVEALVINADEAVTNLPPRPRGKYARTMARRSSSGPLSAHRAHWSGESSW